MEDADGGDLAQKIQRRARVLCPESEVVHDFIQIALALKYIRDPKLLHRDLKAENVFLITNGTVKLGDFGIARVLEPTFQLCRTPIGMRYSLSPEVGEGKEDNSKTDIWSLGCILYELLTLKHSFDAANLNSLLGVIVRGRYQPVSATYSKDLRTLLSRMLTKNPAKRQAINQILGLPFINHKLSSFLDQALLDYEMGHTVLHGRLPLATPTIVLPDARPEGTSPGEDAVT
jgi:NIMA (never in mitosis gene a)-related kinase